MAKKFPYWMKSIYPHIQEGKGRKEGRKEGRKGEREKVELSTKISSHGYIGLAKKFIWVFPKRRRKKLKSLRENQN